MTIIIDGTNGISGVDGSAGTPAYVGNDSDTGLWYPAANTVALSTSGSERLRITSAGDVGIGTTTPANYAGYKTLTINGTSTGGEIDLQAAGVQVAFFAASGGSTGFGSTASTPLILYTNNTERMRIASGGSVGINTSSPTTTLTVDTKQANYTDGIDISNSTQWGYGSSINFRAISTDGGSLNTVSRVQQFWEASNKFGMGFWTYDSSLIERMRINSSGYITMGTTNTNIDAGPGFKFIATTNAYIGMVVESSTNSQTNYHLYSTGAGTYRFYVGAGGTISATATTITAISDIRLKENIRDIDVGLDALMALRPRKFDWKEGKGKDKKGDRGWIAQEFETVFPDMIDEWKDEPPEGEEPYKAVNADLIPILVKAIQELKAELDSVKAELQTLKGN